MGLLPDRHHRDGFVAIDDGVLGVILHDGSQGIALSEGEGEGQGGDVKHELQKVN